MKTARRRPRRPIGDARAERNSSPSTGFAAAGLEKSPDRNPRPITAAKSGAQSRKIALSDWFGEKCGLGGRSQSDRIFQVQRHDFKTGKTELIDLANKEGYLLINRDFMKYGTRRYYMKEINLESLGDKLEIVHVVDNPAPSLAYYQMRLLVFLASLIPNRFLREKITGTGNEILEDKDVAIFSLIQN
ncbi:MAG: hypothetical protein IIA72_02845 [Proteobacteria bacterium]|nr:hypothetical protein [Pseudomonadota bacterium]